LNIEQGIDMTDTNETTNPAAGEELQAGQLAIQKLYVKDASFEAPNTPQIFTGEWKPSMDVKLENRATPLGSNHHEVVLTVTATVQVEDKTAYLAEVQQAGIFTIQGLPPQQLNVALATVCPNILFPFAREAVCDLVTRGGFPQLLLAPVNFDALYAQQMQQQQAAQETTH
jgi:preprotein translocase subunit SecB